MRKQKKIDRAQRKKKRERDAVKKATKGRGKGEEVKR